MLHAFEIEASNVAARRCFVIADLDEVEAAGNLLPHRVLVVEGLARLIDVGELDAGTQADLAAVRLFRAGKHAKQRGFAGTVGSDDADDSARRQAEAQG